MHSFTPGPWIARRMHTGAFDVFDPRGRDVVTVYGGGVEIESREANARLIAAAPVLLEALKALLPRALNSDNANIRDDLVIPIDLTMGEIRMARAAILAATGEQS